MSRTPPPVGSRLAPRRRTSFARRETNLMLLGALLTGMVLALALILLLVERAAPDEASRLRGAGADVLRPLHALVSTPVRLTRAGFDRLGDHFATVDRLRAAEAELESARRRAAEADLLAREVARLEQLLEMRRVERQVVAAARVSALSAHASRRTAVLSAGHAEGVRPGMPVIAADGLAGRVTDTGMIAARMILLTDPASRVPVTVARTGWTGLAVGTGAPLLLFQTDMAGADAPRNGDRLVTSGDGGVFPPGIPVGVIVDAGAAPPRARPAANPSGLGAVVVEAPWLPPTRLSDPPAAGAHAESRERRPAGTPPPAATPSATPSAPLPERG